MQIKSMAGVVAAAVVMACFVGCNPKPVSVVGVDQSILPATAKAVLPQDAELTRVEEETYKDGTKIYVLHYTHEGVAKKIKINAESSSTPSRVFDRRTKSAS